MARSAWQLVELSCNAYELVSVSLYDTLGKDTVGTCSPCPDGVSLSEGSLHRVYVRDTSESYPEILSDIIPLVSITPTLQSCLPRFNI